MRKLRTFYYLYRFYRRRGASMVKAYQRARFVYEHGF